jgi:O-antigen/teichoic acid export membrane protein
MGLRKILGNFFSLFTGETVSRALSFIAIIYLARVLGSEGFGKISFATAIVGYFSLSTTGWGIDKYGIREVAKNQKDVKTHVQNIISVRLSLSIISYILLLLFLLMMPIHPETEKLILIYGFTLFTISFRLVWVFAGLEQMRIIALGAILSQLVFLACVVFFVKTIDQILFVPLAHLGGEIVALAILTIIFFARFGFYRLRLSLSAAKIIFIESFPFGAATVMRVVISSFAIVILGFFIGESAVGWYSAANKIILLLLTFCAFYHFSFFPLISRNCESNKDQVAPLLNASVKYAAILSIPIAFGGTITAPSIIHVIYGSQYSQGIIPLQILIWSIPLFFISGNYLNTLLALNKRKSIVRLACFITGINIVCNGVLTPFYGLIGAAVSVIITELVIFLSVFLVLKKTILDISLFPYLTKPVFSSLFMVLIVMYTIKVNLFLSLTAGILSYFLALIFLKAITLEEIRKILQKTSYQPAIE